MKPPLENTYWVVPNRFLAGEYPGHWDEAEAKQRIETLEAAGVGLFVDLTRAEEPLEPYEPLLETAEYVRMPIVDASVPTPEFMGQILDRLDDAMGQGIMPYLHCWGGIGRTGTTVGCWLARRKKVGQTFLSVEPRQEALEELKRLWRECAKSAYIDSPETREQEDFVRKWKAGQ